MDLGATLCTTKKPDCGNCPVALNCVARQQGQPERFPVKTRKLKRSAQSIWLLWATSEDDAVWLNKRPTPGVWAGLYCFPLFESRGALEAVVPAGDRAALQDAPAFTHVLTHKDLYLHPVQVRLPASALAAVEGAWISAQSWQSLGLPAPIRKLLTQPR
jgi:A/G-specific adenine glycosylase